MNGSWLCRTCSGIDDEHFHLAGVGVTCEQCGMYAFSYYEYLYGKWQPAIIFSVIY